MAMYTPGALSAIFDNSKNDNSDIKAFKNKQALVLPKKSSPSLGLFLENFPLHNCFFIQVFLVSQSSAVFLSNCPIMPFSLEFTQSRQNTRKVCENRSKIIL